MSGRETLGPAWSAAAEDKFVSRCRLRIVPEDAAAKLAAVALTKFAASIELRGGPGPSDGSSNLNAVMSDRIGLAPGAGSFAYVPAAKPTRSMIKPSYWSVAMNNLIYRLSEIHKRLDDEIRREVKRRYPDTIRLLRLKKLKLVVKDRLYLRSLEHHRI